MLENGGSNPIFAQDTPKLGFGDGQKWGKKYMKRERNKLSIFKIEKIPIFPMMRRNLDLGMRKNVKKWGKKYMEREGNKLSIFKIEKIPHFSHDAPKFGFGIAKKM